MDCLFSVGSGRRSRIELEAAGLGFGNRSFSNHADPGTRAADPDLHCSDSNGRRQALKDQMSFEGTLTKTVRYRSVFQESVQRPRGVLREPISLSVTCYSFYKVAAQSFKDAGKDKNIIDSLENSADVSLKYNYDLGEIMGLNPEVMSQMTKDKVNKFIELAKKDFSSLAKEYGMMCKSLVENPEQRTNFWEAKGNKKFK